MIIDDEILLIEIGIAIVAYYIKFGITSRIQRRYWKWRNRPRVITGPMPSISHPYR